MENKLRQAYRNTYDFLNRNIDYKKGVLFGSLAGVAVGLINHKEGILIARKETFIYYYVVGWANIICCNIFCPFHACPCT